ncbi:MAG: 2,3-bisphosphoglycerate-independent phosphoglycerate mutase [Clostridiales bacterium]|jgi:2,3-bisphosphoglycerate-independent phosphoglycerate mutase|nr:2,3-bisphosphoglycerate-independent phosphoglycerate mutase [Clostridiales bacterium]
MLQKVIALIFDGLGDRPLPELGGKTPLEAAATPNFDYLAAQGETGLMHTLGRGVRPGSDVSHLAIFGYPPQEYYTGRGPIEAAGLGIELQSGDIALRGNFATVDADWNILDRRAGRISDTGPFAAALDGLIIDGIEFIVKPGTGHRAGVILRGKGLSSKITDADPHSGDEPVSQVRPLEESPGAHFTATIINKFMKQSSDILHNMLLNRERLEQGLLPANFLLLRGAGIFPSFPSFAEKYGFNACCIAGGGLYRGIGAFLGMDLLDSPGATAMPDTNLAGKFRTALAALEKYDFVFLHIKAADSLGEDGNYAGKRDFLAEADRHLAALVEGLDQETLLLIAADHSTPCQLKAHSADPVPVLFYGPGVRTDEVTSFGERACTKGGLGFIEGKDLMPQILNLLGRLHLLGA